MIELIYIQNSKLNHHAECKLQGKRTWNGFVLKSCFDMYCTIESAVLKSMIFHYSTLRVWDPIASPTAL